MSQQQNIFSAFGAHINTATAGTPARGSARSNTATAGTPARGSAAVSGEEGLDAREVLRRYAEIEATLQDVQGNPLDLAIDDPEESEE